MRGTVDSASVGPRAFYNFCFMSRVITTKEVVQAPLRAYSKKKYRKKSSKSFQPAKGNSKQSNAYNSITGSLGKRIFKSKKAGKAVGNIINMASGGKAKKILGGLGSLISGRGDYQVTQNSIVGVGTSVPQFSSGRICKVAHREYLQDVSSSVAFSLLAYHINPGMYRTFPWLSVLAVQFEEYRILGMVFQFKSTSANALSSTNTALGTIIMATQYNPLLPNFTSKMQMENYEYSTSCRPAEDMIHPIECARGTNPVSELYVRNGDIESNSDIRLYDVGTFQFATVGSQAAAVVGELWVSYDVELIKPRMFGGQQGEAVYSSHYSIPVAGITSGTAYFGSSLPSSTSYESGSNIALTFTNTTITFPDSLVSGQYLISLYYVGDNTVLTNALVITTTSHCLGVAVFKGSGAVKEQPAAGDTSTTQFITECISLTGASAVLTLSSGTLPANLTSMDLIITQFNAEITS